MARCLWISHLECMEDTGGVDKSDLFTVKSSTETSVTRLHVGVHEIILRFSHYQELLHSDIETSANRVRCQQSIIILLFC